MRNVIGSVMVVAMALSLLSAVILFGAVGLEWAAPSLLLGFLGVALWGVKLVAARTVSWKQAPTHWPVLAFTLYALFRYAITPLEYEARVEVIHVVFYALVYFAIANNLYHSRDRTILIGLVGLLVVLQSGYAIWQAASGSDLVLGLIRPDYYRGRGSGTYICPNHLAGFLEMALGLLLGRAAFYRGRRRTAERDTLRKILMVYAALMAGAGLVATFSRAGWLAALVALIALILWSEGRLRATWQRVALGGLIVVMIAGAAFVAPRALERLNRVLVPDQTVGGRTLWWHSTVRIIQDSPLLGTGPATWQWQHQLHRHPDMQKHPVYAHSDVLHLWSDYGLIGWLLVVSFFVCYFWHVAQLCTRKTSSEQRSLAIGGSIGVVAILAHSWGDFNLHIPANALFLVILVGLTAALEDPENRYPRAALGRVPKTALGVVLVLLSLAGMAMTAKMALARHQFNLGNYARKTLDQPEALAFYDKAIQLEPGDPEPYLRRAEVLRLQSIFRRGPDKREEQLELAREAVASYDAAVQRNPFMTLAYLGKADVQLRVLKEPEQARHALEQAAQVDPRNALVYLRLGLFYSDQGEEEKAAEAFATAEMLNPTGDDISRSYLEEADTFVPSP